MYNGNWFGSWFSNWFGNVEQEEVIYQRVEIDNGQRRGRIRITTKTVSYELLNSKQIPVEPSPKKPKLTSATIVRKIGRMPNLRSATIKKE